MDKKKYAVVGVGSRSGMYLNAVMGDYRDRSELVGLCDINMTRMKFFAGRAFENNDHPEVPRYHSSDFDKMIAEKKPDVVVVTTMDRTHDEYICRAMEHGCDVITEKPMTIDAERCQRIIDTVKRTGRSLTVTFNYRYAPRNSKVKELIASGEIGDVTSIHFEWLLDTRHGADYFRRWHRDKLNSGGLMVHKATHHFDLINWWMDSAPEKVFAIGRLGFYGRENAEKRGVTRFYSRAYGSETAANDPFAIHLEKDEKLEDGYQRDQSVFGYNISIEDNISVTAQYRNKAIMSYSLNAHAPWEGYRVMFNGTLGRIELNTKENSYVSGSDDDINLTENRANDNIIKTSIPSILIQKHWQTAREVTYEQAKGGHGGGDTRLLKDIFVGAENDPLNHAAGYEAGAMSILTGVAANRSMATGMPVNIDDLVTF